MGVVASSNAHVGHMSFSHPLASFCAGIGSQDVRSIAQGRGAALQLGAEPIHMLLQVKFLCTLQTSMAMSIAEVITELLDASL